MELSKPLFSFETPKEPSIQEQSKNVCHFCQKSFIYNSSLTKHIRIHTGDKPYECNFEGCGQRFSQVSNLIRHKRIHSGIRPYTCEICDKSFCSSSNLKQHLNIHKNEVSRNKFVCFIRECANTYLYVCTFKKHLQQAHKAEYELISSGEEDKNFHDIFKKLKETPNKFEFLNFKNEVEEEPLKDLNSENNIIKVPISERVNKLEVIDEFENPPKRKRSPTDNRNLELEKPSVKKFEGTANGGPSKKFVSQQQQSKAKNPDLTASLSKNIFNNLSNTQQVNNNTSLFSSNNLNLLNLLNTLQLLSANQSQPLQNNYHSIGLNNPSNSFINTLNVNSNGHETYSSSETMNSDYDNQSNMVCDNNYNNVSNTFLQNIINPTTNGTNSIVNPLEVFTKGPRHQHQQSQYFNANNSFSSSQFQPNMTYTKPYNSNCQQQQSYLNQDYSKLNSDIPMPQSTLQLNIPLSNQSSEQENLQLDPKPQRSFGNGMDCDKTTIKDDKRFSPRKFLLGDEPSQKKSKCCQKNTCCHTRNSSNTTTPFSDDHKLTVGYNNEKSEDSESGVQKFRPTQDTKIKRLKKEDVVCIKDFNLKDFISNDLRKSFKKSVSIDAQSFPSEYCREKCGSFLQCPEMIPQNCRTFQNGECDCIVRCKIMENLFYDLNNHFD